MRGDCELELGGEGGLGAAFLGEGGVAGAGG